MELDREAAQAYVHHAFRQMLDVAHRVGDGRVNERPFGSSTNAISSIIIHCDGVCEWWLGAVAFGRPSTRDRDAEFRATAGLSELDALVAARLAQIDLDLQALDGNDHPDEAWAEHLPGGVRQGSLFLHVLEELYQHLGQIELTADALAARS